MRDGPTIRRVLVADRRGAALRLARWGRQAGVEVVALQFVNVMLRSLTPLAGQNTLAGVMNLQHVLLGLRAIPAENLHQNVRHVLHEVHRIIPAHDEKPGIENFLCLRSRLLIGIW